MDRQITDLINICRELTSEKKQDRKKAAQNLKNCLNHSGIKKALDKNYELKQTNKNVGKGVFSWENVFKAVCYHVNMETEELRHASDNVSRATLTNRETRKQEASALFKCVIRMADKGGPKLKGPALFSHIEETLKDAYTCNSYGQDYCSILLKNVLTCRRYVVELNSQKWHELLFMFCKLFNEVEVKIDKLVLARIIHSLISGITSQCDVRPKKILAFFSEFFSRVRQQKSSTLVEHMLLALNIFIKCIAPTSRIQICKLGEDIFPGMLYLWHNVASEPLKDCLIEFLQTQVWCHHPRGDKQGSTGAYAVDWDKWMSHLRKLYEIMYTEIQQMGAKTRSKDCTLKETFVDLAVDVCQQLFSETTHTIEVTQLSYGIDGDTQTGPGAKKRRLESGWEAIRNFISSGGQTVKVIPWLQLVTRLVEKYTTSLPREEVLAYLTCLSHSLADCKRTELMTYILRCLQSFVCNWQKLVSKATDILVQQTKPVWNQIWTVSLRFVSLHHAEVEGFKLLSAMVEKELVTTGKEIWSLFVPSVSVPVSQSVQFLCQNLLLCDLPERYVPNLVSSVHETNSDFGYPLRKQLIDWLLPSREDEGEGSKMVCKIDPEWTAYALVTLTLRNPAFSWQQPCQQEPRFLNGLEDQYLQMCLEMPLKVEELFCDNSGRQSNEDIVHVAVLLKEVENIIKRDEQYFHRRTEEQVSDIEDMVVYACMMVNIMDLLLQYKILTPLTITSCSLLDMLSSVMKKITTALADVVKKEGSSSIQSAIHRLQHFYSWENTNEEQNCLMSTICRVVTPSRLVDLILDIANEKNIVKQTSSTQLDASLNQSSRFNRTGGARLLDDFDDELDLEFDNQSNNNNNMDIDDLDIDEGMESQELEETNSLEVCPSLLSHSNLSENQVYRMNAVKLLCLWCSHDRHTVRDLMLKSEIDVKYIKSKIVGKLSGSCFDSNRSADIQLVKLIVEMLSTSNQAISDKDLDIILSAISEVVKTHRRDQEVCCTSLDLLVQLVPYLSEVDGLPSNALQDCRDKTLHLVSVLWKLQDEDNSYSSEVRRGLVRFMEKLIECDPTSDWSRFPGGSDEDSEETGPSPATRFIEYGSDYCHMVRMHVSSAVYKLFVRGKGTDRVSRSVQEQVFNQVYDVLNESLDIQGRLSPERLLDETQCRTAGVLTALGTVMCISPVCEKLAVFTLVKLMREKNIEIDVIQRILMKVSSVLGYEKYEKFVEGHLPYLVHKWLHLEFPISKFPHQLLSCDTQETFFRQHIRIIMIPEAINLSNMPTLHTVATELVVDEKDLLRECVPSIVVHILPLFAASKLADKKNDETSRKQTNKASTCYNLLITKLSEEVVERQIVDNLDEIVVNILMCLYDEDLDDGNIRNTNPDPNPPTYNTHITTSTLNYITKSFSGSGKTLVEILSKAPDSIQKILLQLCTRLCSSHRLAEKRRVFHMYQLFTRLLLKQFHTQLGGTWAYVLRDIIIRLVHLIQDMTTGDLVNSTEGSYRESIASMALGLLREVCVAGVDVCPQELKKYLPLLTSNLISVVEKSGDVGKQALSLLKYLILEKSAVLRTTIATLDNFPDKPVFKDCRVVHQKLKYATGSFSLKQEVEHFLTTSKHQNVEAVFRLEGLKFLHEKLSEDHDQLACLTKDGTVCRLVCELIQLTKCSSRLVVLEAARCLGVIGPVNLNTISLPALSSSPGLQMALDCFQDSPDVLKYCKVFHCLNDYLTDKSIQLVQCASSVLKSVLSVKLGMEFSSGYKGQLGDNEFLFHYLHPFRSGKKKPVQVTGTPRSWETFQFTVDQESLWNPHHSNHSNWIITLTTTLINSGAVGDEILRLLGPVCALKSEFCELLLPYLIHDILLSADADHKEVLSRQVDNFFSCYCGQSAGRISRCPSLTTTALPTGDEYICMNVDSVRTMLDVVQYLRQQCRPKQGRKEMTTWDNNFWLDVDYLQVAMAAQYCSAHFSALLYAEIWCDVQRDKTESGSQSQKTQRSSQSLSQDTRIDTLSEASSTQSGVTVQDVLLEAYRWIGEPDGVYGCGAGRKADVSSRICTYQHENQWDKAVISCDIQMGQSGASSQYDVLHALQNFGASHIVDTYLQGMLGNDDVPNLTSDTRELKYEAAWRMGQWNIDTPNKLSESTGFHESVYKAMKAVRDDHFTFTDAALGNARLCVISRLKDGYLNSSQRLYPVLANLQCVGILDSLSVMLKSGADISCVKLPQVTTMAETDFQFTVPILYMTCSALHLTWNKTNNKQLLTSYSTSLQHLAKVAREAGRHQISERAVSNLKLLDIKDLSFGLPGQMEEAQLYWARGEHNIAKHLVRVMIDNLRRLRAVDRAAAQFYPQALSIYGNWLAETRSENPNVIMENYLEKTVKLFEQLDEDADRSMDAYLSLARYADSQYQNILNYMKSSTFEAKQSLMKKAHQEAEGLRHVMGESTKEYRYLRTLEKQGEIDKAELENMLDDKNRFLVKAIENYVKCLKCGDSHNLRVFRLTSLWFNNANIEEVNQLIQGGVSEIKPYKWLPLMYQLAARMDLKPHRETSQLFLNTLNKLIHDTAVTHPHHTLFCVLALANANRDTELLEQGKASKRKLSKSQADMPMEGRVQAAKTMMEKLRQNESVGAIVKDLKTLCDAYIQLANWNVSQHKTETKSIQLPTALWISKVKDLKNIPIPTRDIKVEPSGRYDNIIYIQKFQPTFKLAGGINLPKIIGCLGSDGKNSRQLVKGRDDLRQDAVMQQVFDMVNNLLQKDNETRKRQLQIRKYKVIPLSQRSGLLEWCEGTQPIGEYLVGSAAFGVKGAHTRYRPQDWASLDCRRHLQAAGTVEGKYKAYKEICTHFQPVLRHFFLEKFPSPSVWFERRLAYTRSVATNSIVGYILGLGDRHVQNILIDCNTAELVHIDLGVAFEQGEILPTPETVPFRLTRDIEDAMGASGVEGVFRRCCEKTMEVMRSNQEALLTILEVLLYDPLHAWTISPAKAYALQQHRGDTDTLDIGNTTTGDIMDLAENSTSSGRSNSETQENVNKLAERVLLRLQQKLQGLEDGVQLSLSGQVNHLIQEARNPKNLARLFPGWQPYI